MNFLIADDHTVVRKGLKLILREEFPDSWFDESVSGNETIEKARTNQYDVIILDITMPGRNGLEILKQIKAEAIKTPVLVLSMHPEDQYATRVLRAGAAGFLSKETAAEELVIAIRKILSGRKYITGMVAEKLLAEPAGAYKSPHEMLSDREFEVMRFIASGKTVTEIAGILSVSTPTISTYRTRILEKMQLRNNAELTHYAFSQGIV